MSEEGVCEKYDVARNKWDSLPALNEAKYGTACVLLESKKALSFGGKISHR